MAGAAAELNPERRLGAGLALLVHILLLGLLVARPDVPPARPPEPSPSVELELTRLGPVPEPDEAEPVEALRRQPAAAGPERQRPAPAAAPAAAPAYAPPLPPRPSLPDGAEPLTGAERGEAVPARGSGGAGDAGAAGQGAGLGGAPGSDGRGAGGLAAPEWVRKPSFDEMLRVNPRYAQLERVSGGAVLACRIDRRERAHSCRVLSEAPGGYGFAAAALKAVKLGRLKAPVENGLPQYRAWVRIPIHFRNCSDKEPRCRSAVE